MITFQNQNGATSVNATPLRITAVKERTMQHQSTPNPNGNLLGVLDAAANLHDVAMEVASEPPQTGGPYEAVVYGWPYVRNADGTFTSFRPEVA